MRPVEVAMSDTQIEIGVRGMDCAECVLHVEGALSKVPGVRSARVSLAAEKAYVTMDATRTTLPQLHAAIASAGYSVAGEESVRRMDEIEARSRVIVRRTMTALGLVAGLVLFVIVAGEWLGLFKVVTRLVPWPIGAALVVGGGWPVLRKVALAAWHRQITSHTLMTLGVMAALVVGEWPTAAVVVMFMRIGDAIEGYTTDHARQAVRSLQKLAPAAARVERAGAEVELPLDEVRVGEVVIVRPGERSPVDGEVLEGTASVDQSSMTGEAMPLEAAPGSRIYASSLIRDGALRVRATHIGAESMFGRVVHMVEEAETHRARVQRLADRFAAWYVPFVAAIALLTYLLRRDPLAAAAVLVVACSCSFALATPVALLATLGAAARKGVLIKGGRVLEALAAVDVVLIDKTGTLTLGRPQMTSILPAPGQTEQSVLLLAAAAERYSEHPLGEAIRRAARERGLAPAAPACFSAQPGIGVTAQVGGHEVRVTAAAPGVPGGEAGGTRVQVARDAELLGVLAFVDELRPDVAPALEVLRALGLQHIEMLTGDSPAAAGPLAERLGLACRAGLLPGDKMRIVREYQAAGRRVLMIGDGVNDAPALAQAEVGIAMGVAGSDVALEAAPVSLMRDDWSAVPEVVRMARRTLNVIRGNLAFTTAYNALGLTLAALGILPPIFAAAAQSLPDIGILGNSSRLLRQ